MSCEYDIDVVLGRCRDVFLHVKGQDRLFTRDFTTEELQDRRKKLADKIGPDAYALIPAAPAQAGHRACQDATFYYFSGLDVLQSFLLVRGKDGHSTVFLPPRDEVEGESEDRLGFEEADMIKARLGFDDAQPIDQMGAALQQVTKLYLPFSETEAGGVTRFQANACARKREASEWDGVEPRHKVLLRKLEERYPGMQIEDAGDIIGRLRRVKSPAEIEVLRQAGYLSALIMN